MRETGSDGHDSNHVGTTQKGSLSYFRIFTYKNHRCYELLNL